MKKFITIVLVMFFLAGCNNSNNSAQTNDKQSSINVRNTNIEEVDRKTGQEISKRLVELATSIPNVNDATAVVFGRYAIVGIDVNAKIERSQVGTIKYSVAESLKQDPYGARAIVVADADTNERLKEIQGDIQKGRPLQGIMEELADVAGRLMPEVPGNMIEPTPQTTEKQKRTLPKEQQEELDEKQEEHSNHYKE
jgi:YhcN/YlaJ family sporulation lipoprotein